MRAGDALAAFEEARALYEVTWEQLEQAEEMMVERFHDAIGAGGAFLCEYELECGQSSRQLVHLRPCCDHHAAIHGAGAALVAKSLTEDGS